MGLTVREATGGKLEILSGDKLKRIAAYARGYQIESGRSPFFADGGGSPSHEVWTLMLQAYPEAVPSGFSPVPVLRTRHVAIGLRDLNGEQEARRFQNETALPLRTFFDEAQVLITRSAGDVTNLAYGAAIKGGHNAEHHNHNDVGSYTLVLGGVEMAGDPGGEEYTRRTFSPQRYDSDVLNSYGHPVPVVAGKLQELGREASAKVVSTEFSVERDSIEFDLKAAYDVPELESLNRSYLHDRKNSVIEIVDDVRFSSPQSFSTPVITYREVERKDENSLRLFGEGRSLDVRIEAEGGQWSLEDTTIENPNKPSPRRMAVTFDNPVTEARVRFIFTPSRDSAKVQK